jgi:hypothetical protein
MLALHRLAAHGIAIRVHLVAPGTSEQMLQIAAR